MRSIPVLRHMDAQSRLRLKEAVPAWLGPRIRPNHIRALTRPAGSTHSPEIPLFCLICTWHEGDVIHASVTDAFAQGVSRVFLIDNDSRDDTVDEGVAAGAELVLSYHTDGFDETFKYELVNSFVEHFSRATPHDQIWWLLKDADEFTGAPAGTIPELLSEVDSECRVVGARVLDHFPTPGKNVGRRQNPLSSQPLYREKSDDRCRGGHHKHPLLLWRRSGARITVDPGFHQLTCRGEALFEPPTSLVMHHHPFRDEDRTRQRARLLAARGFVGEHEPGVDHAHVRSRMRQLDLVYSGNHAALVDYRTGRPGIELERWHSPPVGPDIEQSPK